MIGWGSGGNDEVNNAFSCSPDFRIELLDWVRKGGCFLVQGERVKFCGDWPKRFDKTWKDGSYYRTDHMCFAGSTHWRNWYKESPGAFTGRCNVKACMLENVANDEILFGTEEGA